MLKGSWAKSDILYNTGISWETQFKIVDETGIDEKGVDVTVLVVDENGIDKLGFNHPFI